MHLILSGILFGISTLCRYSNPFLIGSLVGVFAFTKDFKILFKRFFYIGIGYLPFLIFFIIFNNYLYLAPFRSGYFFSNEEQIHLWSQIPLYSLIFIGILTLVYPLMFVAPFFVKKHLRLKIVTYLMCIIIFIIYGSFPNIGEIFHGRIVDILFGSRYLLVVVPLFLLSYAFVLTKFEIRWPKFKIIYNLFVLFLACLTIILTVLHQIFLKNR